MFRKSLTCSSLFIALVAASLAAQQNDLASATSGGVAAVTAPSIERREIRVWSTNDQWTETGFRLQVGDVVTLTTPDTVRLGQYTRTSAAGTRGFENPPKPIQVGTLVGKVGAHGTSFAVGPAAFWTVTAPGTLRLQIYDTIRTDNTGAYTVTIMRVPASMIPPAQPAPNDPDGD